MLLELGPDEAPGMWRYGGMFDDSMVCCSRVSVLECADDGS